MVRPKKIQSITSSYHEWLINSLHNKKEIAAYLKASFNAYRKDGNTKALSLALRNIAEVEDDHKLNQIIKKRQKDKHKAIKISLKDL